MAHIHYVPVDSDTVVPASASVPAGAFDFGGTAIDDNDGASKGDIVYTAGVFTLATDVLDLDLVRVSWGLNVQLNHHVNFSLVADGVEVRGGSLDVEHLRAGSIVLSAAEVGAGVQMKLWCSDTDIVDLPLLALGSYMSVEGLSASQYSSKLKSQPSGWLFYAWSYDIMPGLTLGRQTYGFCSRRRHR